MLKLKRLLSFSLLASILLQCAACGSSESSDDPQNSTSDDTTSEYVAPNVDYGGRTVSITGYNYSGIWAILNYHIALEEENGDVINDAIVKRNRAVESVLNVNIELIPLGSGDRASAAILEKYIMAQDDVVTYGMQMNAGLSSLLTTEGMLVDLKEISTLDLTNTWWNQNANDEYTIYGKQYAAVGDACLFNLGAPVVTYFSKVLAEESKLDNPYQLVYDGKWTLDTMIKMASDVSRDINGNTEVDKDDIFGFAGEHDTIFYAMFGSGVRYSTRDGSGNLQAALNDEKSVDLTEKLVTLLRDKQTTLYNVDWAANYTGNVFAEFFMPKLMNNELLFFSNQLHVALSLRAMESDFGILPMPKYDEKQENYVSIANTWFSDHIVVPSTNTDLEMTGYLLDAMGYYAQEYITPAFIDYSVKDKGARDEDSVNMINIILENQIFDVGLMFNWGGMTSMLVKMVQNSTPSFASSWAGIESAVNTELAKTVAMLKGE